MNEIQDTKTVINPTANNNALVIEGLRAMIAWLQAHPLLPAFTIRETEWVYTKDQLLAFVANMGAFRKEADVYYFRIVKEFNPKVRFVVAINREAICRKRVIWECPEDGLLAAAQDLRSSDETPEIPLPQTGGDDIPY